jgi:hypothetical protein
LIIKIRISWITGDQIYGYAHKRKINGTEEKHEPTLVATKALIA